MWWVCGYLIFVGALEFFGFALCLGSFDVLISFGLSMMFDLIWPFCLGFVSLGFFD